MVTGDPRTGLGMRACQPVWLPDMPKQKQRFEVEVEAKLTVLAFDESSARKKVERALRVGHNLDTDVEVTGAVWTYATTPRAAAPTA